MKNVTITLDEEVARWARIWAAEHDTSVSRLIGDLLHQRMLEEQAYHSSMKQHLAAKPRRLKRSGKYPSRQELHER